MKIYTVADAAKMLNVNEETVRRWIRAERIKAERSLGRGGNAILLQDIIDFANTPPRAYLLSLETWLTANNIPFEKIEDPKEDNNTGTKISAAAVGGAAATGIAAAAGGTTLAALSGPAGIGIGLLGYSVAKAVQKKRYQTYTIRLINGGNPLPSNEKTVSTKAEEAISPPSEVAAPTAQSNSPSAPSATAAPTGVLGEIAQAKNLLDAGILTPEEFLAIKTKLIAKI